MSEQTRQDDPIHIPADLRMQAPDGPARRRPGRARRLVAFGVVAAAMLVPATAAAAVAEHHLHPHPTFAVAVASAGEDRLRTSRVL